MKKILLILPYFGKWPIWFDGHLLSIGKNPTIDWLFVTDCEIPKVYPKNIKFVTTTLQELNNHVNQVVGVDVPLTPRKFCDLKPAYGAIFKEHVEGYDFWGFCDMDIIWGNIRNFITEDILNQYDIISSRKGAISGHFNLFRNLDMLNNLYKQVENYKDLFVNPKFMWFDEHVLTNYLMSNQCSEKHLLIYWPDILLNQERGRDSHQEYHLDKWQWNQGKMFRLGRKKIVEEVMYLHFINWKKTMKMCEVKFSDSEDRFYISYSGIYYDLHSNFEIYVNVFKNLFGGYYVKEKKRIFIRTFKKKLKRFEKINVFQKLLN